MNATARGAQNSCRRIAGASNCTRALCIAVSMLSSAAFLGCGKPNDPNDWLVGHWLNDPDGGQGNDTYTFNADWGFDIVQENEGKSMHLGALDADCTFGDAFNVVVLHDRPSGLCGTAHRAPAANDFAFTLWDAA